MLQRQAAVAAGSLLVVASAVSQAPNDKQQLEPMLDKIAAFPKSWASPNACWRIPGLLERGGSSRLATRRGSNR